MGLDPRPGMASQDRPGTAEARNYASPAFQRRSSSWWVGGYSAVKRWERTPDVRNYASPAFQRRSSSW